MFVLFASGKVVETGSRTWNEAKEAYDNIIPLLAKYKLGEEYKTFDNKFKRTRNVDICALGDEDVEIKIEQDIIEDVMKIEDGLLLCTDNGVKKENL